MDKYLGMIPDQPEYQGMILGGRTVCGRPPNSITDWTRVLNIYFSTNVYDDKLNSNVILSCIGRMAQPSPPHCV